HHPRERRQPRPANAHKVNPLHAPLLIKEGGVRYLSPLLIRDGLAVGCLSPFLRGEGRGVRCTHALTPCTNFPIRFAASGCASFFIAADMACKRIGSFNKFSNVGTNSLASFSSSRTSAAPRVARNSAFLFGCPCAKSPGTKMLGTPTA